MKTVNLDAKRGKRYAYNKAYREANREKVREKDKAWQKANQEKVRGYNRKAYMKHTEKHKALHAAYYKARKAELNSFKSASKSLAIFKAISNLTNETK